MLTKVHRVAAKLSGTEKSLTNSTEVKRKPPELASPNDKTGGFFYRES